MVPSVSIQCQFAAFAAGAASMDVRLSSVPYMPSTQPLVLSIALIPSSPASGIMLSSMRVICRVRQAVIIDKAEYMQDNRPQTRNVFTYRFFQGEP